MTPILVRHLADYDPAKKEQGDLILYCGRRRASTLPKGMRSAHMGNPHVMSWCPVCRKTHTRAESIIEFERELDKGRWAEQMETILATMQYVACRRVILLCHCHPLPCHCDVIKARLEEKQRALEARINSEPWPADAEEQIRKEFGE